MFVSQNSCTSWLQIKYVSRELHSQQSRLPNELLWGNHHLQGLLDDVKVHHLISSVILFLLQLLKEILVCWIFPFVICRGIFFQGYLCTRCKMAAHKECLGRVPACGRNSGLWTYTCTYTLHLISVIIVVYHNVSLFSSNYRSHCYFEEGEILAGLLSCPLALIHISCQF